MELDEEFRLLQATYNYPWSFDSNHLHMVLLEPIPTSQLTNRLLNRPGDHNISFVSTTNKGRTIC